VKEEEGRGEKSGNATRGGGDRRGHAGANPR